MNILSGILFFCAIVSIIDLVESRRFSCGLFIGTSLAVQKNPKKDAKRISVVEKVEKHKKAKPKKIKEAILTEEETNKIIKRQQSIESLLQMLISVGSMVYSRRIFQLDFNNPKIKQFCRFVFCGYLLVFQLLNFLLSWRIKSLNDQTIVEQSSMINPIANVVGSLLGKVTGKKKPITIMQYDLTESSKIFGGLIPEALAMIVLNVILKKAFFLLLMLPLMGITNLLKNPIIQIHFFGFKSVGKLKRPFQSQIESMMKAMSEKAAVTETPKETATAVVEEVQTIELKEKKKKTTTATTATVAKATAVQVTAVAVEPEPVEEEETIIAKEDKEDEDDGDDVEDTIKEEDKILDELEDNDSDVLESDVDGNGSDVDSQVVEDEEVDVEVGGKEEEEVDRLIEELDELDDENGGNGEELNTSDREEEEDSGDVDGYNDGDELGDEDRTEQQINELDVAFEPDE